MADRIVALALSIARVANARFGFREGLVDRRRPCFEALLQPRTEPGATFRGKSMIRESFGRVVVPLSGVTLLGARICVCAKGTHQRPILKRALTESNWKAPACSRGAFHVRTSGSNQQGCEY